MAVDRDIFIFCNIIRSRSEENRKAIATLSRCGSVVIGPSFSILRQELDSMVRVVYLLNISSLSERKRLIKQTLSGEQWTTRTEKGRERKITDKEMIDITNNLYGWTLSVYKFGCSFIHLSNFHNYLSENPVSMLRDNEKEDIIHHMKHYYGYHSDTLDVQRIWPYIPSIFDKISGNLHYYIEGLQNNSTSSL